MKKLVAPVLVVAGLSASLLVGATGVSWAQEPPKPVDIKAEKACGTVTLTFANPNSDAGATVGFRWNAVKGDVATSDGSRTGTVDVGPKKTVKETVRFEEDEFGGVAALTVAPFFGANGPLNAPLDLFPVDTDCALPGNTPDTTTTPPTTTPEPTDEPDPTTTPAPPTSDNGGSADLDCGDFPLADGRTAQQVLDADLSDPNVLDIDRDGLACEVDDPAPVDNDDNGLDAGPIVPSVVTPVGGVETGGGPA